MEIESELQCRTMSEYLSHGWFSVISHGRGREEGEKGEERPLSGCNFKWSSIVSERGWVLGEEKVKKKKKN